MRYPRSDPGLGALGRLPGALKPRRKLPAGQREVNIVAALCSALWPAALRSSWTTQQGDVSQDSTFRMRVIPIEARLPLVDVLH